jgi:hypothetical protein
MNDGNVAVIANSRYQPTLVGSQTTPLFVLTRGIQKMIPRGEFMTLTPTETDMTLTMTITDRLLPPYPTMTMLAAGGR